MQLVAKIEIFYLFANGEGDFFLKRFYYGETKEHKNIIFRPDKTHTKYVIFVLLYSNLINGRNTGKQGVSKVFVLIAKANGVT